MGTPLVAGWIAQFAFWTLLIIGVWSEDVGPRRLATFLALWCIGLVGLPLVAFGAGLFTPFVAVLDVILVLVVFKGDIRLT